MRVTSKESLLSPGQLVNGGQRWREGDQLANWQAQLLETQPNVIFLPEEIIFVRFQKFIKLNTSHLKERRNTGKTSQAACSCHHHYHHL